MSSMENPWSQRIMAPASPLPPHLLPTTAKKTLLQLGDQRISRFLELAPQQTMPVLQALAVIAPEFTQLDSLDILKTATFIRHAKMHASGEPLSYMALLLPGNKEDIYEQLNQSGREVTMLIHACDDYFKPMDLVKAQGIMQDLDAHLMRIVAANFDLAEDCYYLRQLITAMQPPLPPGGNKTPSGWSR